MHRLIDRTIFSLCITQPTTHLVEKTNAAGLRRINRFPLARVVDVNNYFYRITIKTDDVDYICDQEKHTSPEWIEILVRLPPLSLDPNEYEPWALNGRAVYDWLESVQSSKGSFTFYEWLNEFRPYWNKANEATMSVFFVAVIKKRIESLRCGDASIPGLVPVVSYLDYSSRVVDERTMGPKLVYGGHLRLRGCVSIPHKPVSEDRTYVPAPLPKDGGRTVKRVHICKDNEEEEEYYSDESYQEDDDHHQITSGGGEGENENERVDDSSTKQTSPKKSSSLKSAASFIASSMGPDLLSIEEEDEEGDTEEQTNETDTSSLQPMYQDSGVQTQENKTWMDADAGVQMSADLTIERNKIPDVDCEKELERIALLRSALAKHFNIDPNFIDTDADIDEMRRVLSTLKHKEQEKEVRYVQVQVQQEKQPEEPKPSRNFKNDKERADYFYNVATKLAKEQGIDLEFYDTPLDEAEEQKNIIFNEQMKLQKEFDDFMSGGFTVDGFPVKRSIKDLSKEEKSKVTDYERRIFLLEQKVAKWNSIIEHSEEYKRKQMNIKLMWDESQKDLNIKALIEMKSIYTPEKRGKSYDVLKKLFPEERDDLLMRLGQKAYVFDVFYIEKQVIEAQKIETLLNVYNYINLDITELRAVYICFPNELEFKEPIKKQWRSEFRVYVQGRIAKAEELEKMKSSGKKLSKGEQDVIRNSVYLKSTSKVSSGLGFKVSTKKSDKLSNASGNLGNFLLAPRKPPPGYTPPTEEPETKQETKKPTVKTSALAERMQQMMVENQKAIDEEKKEERRRKNMLVTNPSRK